MHGYNKDEAAPFLLQSQANLKNYEDKIRNTFDEPYASRVLEFYPASTNEEAKKNWEEINTVFLFTYGHYCWERQALKNDIPSYVYHFVKENGRLGAWHSGEEVYLYGNIPDNSRLYDEDDRALSDVMTRYYLNFLRTGDPNGKQLPEWPASTGDDHVLELGEDITWKEAPYLTLNGILDEMYGYE